MGQQFSELSEKHIEFIQAQKIYFVGTATADSRVNISPKGMDSLRVINRNKVLWLSVTGSGNETSAHVQINPRMTIMFMATEGNPLILRLYGKAKVIHQSDDKWAEYYSLFNPLPGARQIYELDVDMVQNSCGMAVPFFEYAGDREQLRDWATKKSDSDLKDYWRKKNAQSIDGIETGIVEKNC